MGILINLQDFGLSLMLQVLHVFSLGSYEAYFYVLLNFLAKGKLFGNLIFNAFFVEGSLKFVGLGGPDACL